MLRLCSAPLAELLSPFAYLGGVTDEGGDPACWAHLFEEDNSLQFKAELELNGKSATGIAVPDVVVEQLGGGRRPAVVVGFNGYTYRTTIGSMGGRYLIPVAAERRDAAGVKAGDRLTVDISLDSVPREVEVPKYIADAFKKAGVLPAFDKLSYSHRKEHVRAIEDAKTEATRERRIAKAIEKLQS